MSLEIMIEHAARVLEVRRSMETMLNTYRQLCEEFPELSKMSFESFRVYCRAIDAFEKKYPIANKGTVSHKLANHKIAGWNVTPNGKYYRAFRRIGGKLHSLYIGKSLEDAGAKIRTKEAAIRGQGACNPPYLNLFALVLGDLRAFSSFRQGFRKLEGHTPLDVENQVVNLSSFALIESYHPRARMIFKKHLTKSTDLIFQLHPKSFRLVRPSFWLFLFLSFEISALCLTGIERPAEFERTQGG